MVAVLFPDIDFPAGKLIDDLIASEERHRVAAGQIEDRAAHFFLGQRRDVDVEPERRGRAKDRDDGERKANPGDAHAVGPKRDQFVVRREPAKDEQDRGEKAPRDGEDEGERQNIGDEADKVFGGQIVIDEQRQQLAEDIADDEDEAEHGDREEEIHEELAAHVTVDQIHRCGLLVPFCQRGKRRDPF